MQKFKIQYATIFLSIFYLTNCSNQSSKLPYSNLDDFSTASGFIYVDLKYLSETYTIVIDNSGFYGSLNHYMFHGKLSKRKYKKIVAEAILENTQINVSKELDTEMKYFAVNKELIKKYQATDIFKKGYIRPDGMFVDSVNRENQRAIIYILLKKGIRNCYKECESGRPVVSKD